MGMPLKLTLADEKRQPAAPPPPRRARRAQVSRRDGLRVAASVVVAFTVAALLGDALLGGRGRAVVEDRIASALHAPAPQVSVVGAIHR